MRALDARPGPLVGHPSRTVSLEAVDETQIERFRSMLLTLRDELQASLDAESEDSKPVEPDRAIGRLTRQDAMQAQQMALEIKRRGKARLAQVSLALERIEQGTYGYCSRCEEEISQARLEVRPEAPVCIGCADPRLRR